MKIGAMINRFIGITFRGRARRPIAECQSKIYIFDLFMHALMYCMICKEHCNFISLPKVEA